MQRKNIQLSRTLRKNQTDAEKKLWSKVRSRQLCGIKFRRQVPLGNYIVDFYCPEYRIAIEADGGQHYASDGKLLDAIRTKELNKTGVEVLRFSDHDILTNADAVIEVIQQTIEKRTKYSPHLNPLPGGERK